MSPVIIILLSLLTIGFFAGMEIAFLSSNKLKFELKRKDNTLISRVIAKFLKSPSLFLGTTLVGLNIFLTIYGISMSNIISPILKQFIASDFVILLVQTIITTLIVLIISEFIPKVLFRIKEEALLLLISRLGCDNNLANPQTTSQGGVEEIERTETIEEAR